MLTSKLITCKCAPAPEAFYSWKMLVKLLSEKRILICTFVALASGLFGSYVGGQINWFARTAQCQNQPEGLNHICRAWQTPGALWQGSIAGAWTGTILGVFIAGLATRDKYKEDPQRELIQKEGAIAPVSNLPCLEGLTANEIATLRKILSALLAETKIPSKSSANQGAEQKPSETINRPLSVSEFICWADLVAKSTPNPPKITRNQGREILIYLGFSENTIDTAWQNLNHSNK